MQRIIKITDDGSPTFYVPYLNEYYHSLYGARDESEHVFIENGFRKSDKKVVSVFEVGLGTGLNAWLTCLEAEKSDRTVVYHSVELFPLERAEWSQFEKHLGADKPNSFFRKIHECSWGAETAISSRFRIKKIICDITGYETASKYDIVYFDAFGPDVQPEMWTVEIFSKISSMMSDGGLLSTYSSKGEVRRNMQAGGLRVIRVPGPRGKRQITLAFKSFEEPNKTK
ncbi:MAG: SAM-dependent methyltransferase [Marinilabiliales bacterium]|nr:MAG: SAM-dependent methyltransferase [Marinilabiliales bacterium]